MPNFLSVAVMSDMEGSVDSLISTFTTIFSAGWNMISGNWFLLASVGIPLIAGILFAVIGFFRNR